MFKQYRDVNDAFDCLVTDLDSIISGKVIDTGKTLSKESSRNGDVYRFTSPVMIQYTNPTNRVLLNPGRNPNPFFHLYEALWMLAGRNDLAPLVYYNSKFGQYSDDGVTLNGAYGYRWRHAQVPDHQNWEDGNGVDQLEILIEHLKADPNSRRAVLQMWNVEDDLLKIGVNISSECQFCEGRIDTEPCSHCTDGWVETKAPVSKDVCCNLCVMFSIRTGGQFVVEGPPGAPWAPYLESNRFLDMTVVNRSNDAIWGMLGANYVHFTVLQEYMAKHLGVKVGVYTQITNNLHVYTWNWKPEEWKNGTWSQYAVRNPPTPLISDVNVFDEEVLRFVEMNQNGAEVTQHTTWQEPFLNNVAQPMCHAWHMYKQNDLDAADHWVNLRVRDNQWRAAANIWLRNLAAKREKSKSNADQDL